MNISELVAYYQAEAEKHKRLANLWLALGLLCVGLLIALIVFVEQFLEKQ